MSETAYLPAKLSRQGDRVRIVLDLMLDDHVEAVWAALTRPDRLLEWLAPGEIAAEAGGPARLNFPESGTVIDSRVTAIEPMKLLEYSWSGPGEPERPLRWALEPIGATTHLTLTLTMPADEDAAKACAGWAAHMEMLAAALAGMPVKFPFALFQAARAAYRAQFEADAAAG
jgi:uncharacterized protein YndB with AHSA1/START domain